MTARTAPRAVVSWRNHTGLSQREHHHGRVQPMPTEPRRIDGFNVTIIAYCIAITAAVVGYQLFGG